MFPILQMGMSYPADVELVAEFSGLCRNMIVIEERRSFLEKNIRDGLFQALPHDRGGGDFGPALRQNFPGGMEGIPETRGLNFSVLAQKLIPLIQSTAEIDPHRRNGRLTAETRPPSPRRASRSWTCSTSSIVARTPTFCPGCPHRDSSATLLELRKNLADPKYMADHHGMGPVDLVAHGDTGCYTMLMFAPTEQLMHNYSGMGLGGGTGSGIDPVHHQQADRLHGRWNVLPFRAGRHQQLHQGQPGHHLHHPGKQDHGDDRPPGTCRHRTGCAGQSLVHPGHRGDRPRHGRHQPADGRQALAGRSVAIQIGAGTHDSQRWRESRHRRQGMRHHASAHRS